MHTLCTNRRPAAPRITRNSQNTYVIHVLVSWMKIFQFWDLFVCRAAFINLTNDARQHGRYRARGWLRNTWCASWGKLTRLPPSCRGGCCCKRWPIYPDERRLAGLVADLFSGTTVTIFFLSYPGGFFGGVAGWILEDLLNWEALDNFLKNFRLSLIIFEKKIKRSPDEISEVFLWLSLKKFQSISWGTR